MLKNISRQSPLIALVQKPMIILPILQSYADGIAQFNLDHLRLLMINAPIILRWIKSPLVRVGASRQIHELLRPLLQEIIRKCQLLLDFPIISKPSLESEWLSTDDWTVGQVWSPLFNYKMVYHYFMMIDTKKNQQCNVNVMKKNHV
jgi:hypothetical protein